MTRNPIPIMDNLTPAVEQRFWSNVAWTNSELECWPWKGKPDSRGYPRMRVFDKKIRGHRIAWAIHHGEDPPGDSVIDHTCGNRMCCNPAHLECVSQAENTRRAYRYRQCKRGHRYNQRDSRSNCRQCYRLRRERIRLAAATLGITQTEYKKRYGFSEAALRSVLTPQQFDVVR